jgi:hypothetical protein
MMDSPPTRFLVCASHFWFLSTELFLSRPDPTRPGSTRPDPTQQPIRTSPPLPPPPESSGRTKRLLRISVLINVVLGALFVARFLEESETLDRAANVQDIDDSTNCIPSPLPSTTSHDDDDDDGGGGGGGGKEVLIVQCVGGVSCQNHIYVST